MKEGHHSGENAWLYVVIEARTNIHNSIIEAQ